MLEKLSTENITSILKRSLKAYEAIILDENDEYPSLKDLDFTPK